jgi:hypothetical protein
VTTTGHLADLATELVVAIDATDPALAAMLRELLDYPLTADDLDNRPDADEPSPALAEFTASRAAHPVNPAAGPTAASAGDLDHHDFLAEREPAPQAALASPRRERSDRADLATDAGRRPSDPTGRKYTIEPHDYRLGP